MFTYAIPPGFKVTSEGQDNLLIALGNTASASFLLTLLPAGDGVTSVQTLQQYVFAHENLKVTKVLSTALSPTQTTSSRAVAQDENLQGCTSAS